MTARIQWAKAAPDAFNAMLAMEEAVTKSGLDKPLLELVRLRASQINGCAYCVNMHAEDARKGGETEARLQTLGVWRDTDFFTPRERAALAWTESNTKLSQQHPSDQEFEALRQHFSDAEIVNLTLAIATINAWNRFGVGMALKP
ncbi:carboxymuconolactone decarboxylase family protein [Gallaecimonas kandeliae]|uniref:carboxymuconolactone decarboxylase family protein n=1 Tax=Gallaecimonas kandeliae TaxID=3029055 RepID=UPI002648CEB0|nr:carboxymuconolactone decarboxylase family protein [Gallaecimonas kandeliae]WKE67278.1 carboxymuconolactone decarboxylase family protein [Gallaecimonas kandeliae]